MGVRVWWRNMRLKRAANRRLGVESRGGEQGAFEQDRRQSYEPYIRAYQQFEKTSPWIIGKDPNSGKWLAMDDELHGCGLGSTRCGKTTTFLAYNIALHLGSSVIFDPKGELYGIFYKTLAAKGKRVFLWDPFKRAARMVGMPSAPYECGCNLMLDMMNELGEYDPELPNRIANLVNVLVSLGKNGESAMQFWNIKTTEVVSALFAYAAIKRDEDAERAYDDAVEAALAAGRASIDAAVVSDVIRHRNILFASGFPTMPRDEQVDLLEEMAGLEERIRLAAEERGEVPLYPSVITMIKSGVSTALRLLDDGGDAFSQLLDMISACFKWIDSPVIEDHLRGLDAAFTPSMLKTLDDVVLFVVMPDSMMESHGAYLRMALTAIIDACTAHSWADGVNPNRYKINVICDEISLWGHMESLMRAFKRGAGSDLRIIIIDQNISEFERIYGRHGWNTVVCNSWQMLMAGGDIDTGKYFVEKSGNTRARDPKTGERFNVMVPVFGLDQLWNTVHRLRRISLFCENGTPFTKVMKIPYFDTEESGLVKYVDFGPHPEHERDEFLAWVRGQAEQTYPMPDDDDVPQPARRAKAAHMEF